MTATVIKPLICHLDPVPVKQRHTNLHRWVNHVTRGGNDRPQQSVNKKRLDADCGERVSEEEFLFLECLTFIPLLLKEDKELLGEFCYTLFFC